LTLEMIEPFVPGTGARNFFSSREAQSMTTLVTESFESARFGDTRLTKRFMKVMDRLNAAPHLSIPAAMHGRAEMEAAYRFFDNSQVTPDTILAPHVSATHERIRQVRVAVLVQDTTEIDVTRPEVQVDGVGPLTTQTRVGLYHHPLVAFDDQGLPLGTVWDKTWAREGITENLTTDEKRELRRMTPIEEKESMRWLEGVREAVKTAKACPQTQCICVADSEADIYELFCEPRKVSETCDVQLVIRACHDRSLNHGQASLLAAVRATPCLGTTVVDVSRRLRKIRASQRSRTQPRDARTITAEIRAITCTLRAPHRHDRVLPPVTVNVVLIEERDPPEGEVPIQWILITTLPIDTGEQIQLIIDYYKIRWQIEVYFKTLKTGCRVEERYFQRIGRLLNCFAAYRIVAWKVLYLCRLSRECPDMSCEVVFEPCEWKPVYMALRHKQPPRKPPTLNEMVKMIASLGGHVIRKSTQPGTQTLWIGLQRLYDFSTAWEAFEPDTRN
jgi:hypothetical protein